MTDGEPINAPIGLAMAFNPVDKWHALQNLVYEGAKACMAFVEIKNEINYDGFSFRIPPNGDKVYVSAWEILSCDDLQEFADKKLKEIGL